MKNDLVYLKHIDEFCEDLKFYFYEIKDFEEFKKSKLYQDAIVRKLEIIGEASSHISDDLKNKYPQVEWKKIKAMRNRLIHAYFGIDLLLVWEVLIRDIPILHKQIKQIIKDLND
jgi:uncharacterized protein with HEPN domain